MDLTVTVEDIQGTVVLALDGELDVHTAPPLRSKIEELVAGRTPDLVIDLSNVAFMDPIGLSVHVGT